MQTLDPRTEHEWDAYLRDREGSLVYQSLAWRDLLVDLLGCQPEYLLVRRGGRVAGILPMMWHKRGERAIVNSLPYFGSNGGIIADDETARALLLAAWNERACDAGTASATMISNPFVAPTQDGVRHTHVDSRWNHATPLRRGQDPLALAESSAARNVRKAERSSVIVERASAALDDLAGLHAEHMQALGGRVKDDAFFSAVRRRLTPGDQYDVYVARLEGDVAAGLLVLYFGQTVEYYLPATAPRHRAAQPLAPILRTAMTEAAAHGFTRWNWGGSWPSQEGIVRFKSKWGGAPSQYAYYTQLNDPDLRYRTPNELLALGGHFFVVPFSSLTPQGGKPSLKT